MRVLLKLVLPCEPDAAWRAIRSPEVFRKVSSPFTTFTSLESDGYPESWPAGDHPVAVKAFGVVPIGEQIISDQLRGTRAKGAHRHGLGSAGFPAPLTAVKYWRHTMAVSPATGGGTLFRDRLEFRAGVLTPALWVMYWCFWQWRAFQLRRLAPGWS